MQKCRLTGRSLVLLCAVSVMSSSLATSPGNAAQVAASIEYDFIARPAGLSPEFESRPDSSVRFLAIKAIDGFQVDGSLWQPNGKQTAETTLVVMVHGSGGSYMQPPQSGLGPRLAAKGYASLAINTRQHDDKLNTDNFLDIRRDIDAAVQVGRALGYKSLVLLGHSLGNIQVQFYAATNWDRDIKAVVLLGAFANLPWKSRNILVQDDDRFQKLAEASIKSVRDGTADQVLPVKMKFSAPVNAAAAEAPITGQHFLTYRWDKTSIADGTYWIHRLPYPILMVRDQSDGAIAPFEPYMLLSAAHEEGSLVKQIDYVLLADSKPPSLSGHSFVGNEQPLADTLGKWLADHHL
jgi:pimeloyl-ACP methyl ester carboxylesterase